MEGDKKILLLAEDELPMLEALSVKFRNEGFTVIEAKDGEEAVSKALDEHPHLLMLDILMPKMDGLAVAKKVRGSSKWGEQVPIIMLTNLSDPQSVSEAANYMIFDFLVKTDWKLDDIVKLVKSKLHLDNQ